MKKTPVLVVLPFLFLLVALFIGNQWLSVMAAPVVAANNQIAVTTTVDNLDGNDGRCSLREAVYNANENGQWGTAVGECPAGSDSMTDQIWLQAGAIYSLTIAGNGPYSGSLPIKDNPAAVDLQLVVSGTATTTPATIQMGVPGQRVLTNQGATVVLADLVLTGGATAVNGGGIFNQGVLTLTNVVLQQNSARDGGGLYNTGTAVLMNSQITANMATVNGGGIANSGGGQVTLAQTHLLSNTANHNGGGLTNIDDHSVVTLTHSTLISNTAVSGDGGGLYTLSAVAATHVLFHNNAAVGGVGGALYSGRAVVTGQMVTLTHNAALAGGGLYNINGDLHLSGGLLQANQATNGDGGGLVNNGAMARTILLAVDFEDNGATGVGGAVAHRGALVDLSGSIVQQNQAAQGAGLYLAANTATTLRQAAVISNTAGQAGGGIFNWGELTLGNVTLSQNSAVDGGGLYIAANGSLTGTTTAVNITVAANASGQNIVATGPLLLGNSIISSTITPGCHLTGLAITSLGHNLTNDNSCAGLTQTTDLVTDTLGLAQLAFNYSPLPTHALLAGSPARDGGEAAACAAFPVDNVDQRGWNRPWAAPCDIGAHEEMLPLRNYLPLVTKP